MAVPPPPTTEQLDNNVRAIFLQLNSIEETQAQHGQRFDTLGKTMIQHGKTLGEHGKRFDSIDNTLVQHGKILAEHSERFESIECRLDSIEGQLAEDVRLLGEIVGLLRDKA